MLDSPAAAAFYVHSFSVEAIVCYYAHDDFGYLFWCVCWQPGGIPLFFDALS